MECWEAEVATMSKYKESTSQQGGSELQTKKLTNKYSKVLAQLHGGDTDSAVIIPHNGTLYQNVQPEQAIE